MEVAVVRAMAGRALLSFLNLPTISLRESADVKLAFVELYAERILEVGKIMAEAIKAEIKYCFLAMVEVRRMPST